MINSLYIKNLAIINELEVKFENGLNIITGETGSGKSIIVNAISYLLGGRFLKDHMRTNSKTTVIEGQFTVSNQNHIIRRVINSNGKSRIFIDDEPVKLLDLVSFSKRLVDMHGQHDHQQLLNPANHLTYLDRFGDYDSLIDKVSKEYHDLEKIKAEINTLVLYQKDLDEQKELLNFQLEEIQKYELYQNIDSKISSEYETLSRSSEIISILNDMNTLLEFSDNSVITLINGLKSSISKISNVNESLSSIESRLESSSIELSDLSQEIDSIKNNININPQKLKELDEKLSHIEMLKRKYGGTVLNVINYKNELIEKLDEQKNVSSKIPKLKQKSRKLIESLTDSVSLLTNNRKKAIKRLSSNITEHIHEMDMQSSEFYINLNDLKKITEYGKDECEFFIKTNMGETPKPLVKIASGGEISRIMLAIKLAFQKRDRVDTLIFDEIDNGISGSTAQRVGEKINELSNTYQVICISHLPQIAAKGNTHLKVIKNVDRGRTYVDIQKLNYHHRVKEIASLISGYEISKASIKQAENILEGLNG